MVNSLDRRQWLKWGVGSVAAAHLGLQAESAWPQKPLTVVALSQRVAAPTRLRAHLPPNLPR